MLFRRAWRRQQAITHRDRRLKEDRNQHYRDLTCACWFDPKAMARFREQPQHTSCTCCINQRRVLGPIKNQFTIAELRGMLSVKDEWPEDVSYKCARGTLQRVPFLFYDFRINERLKMCRVISP